MTALVFLHIPKTAGQTVHSELARVVGADQVSPVRVHTQAERDAQFPHGYKLYSGHLDWGDMRAVDDDRFVFTVLRDPFERIASFYFYLHAKAQDLSKDVLHAPENTGLRHALEWSTDDYFFGGDAGWQRFILDHYDNFYCTYLSTQRMRGSLRITTLNRRDLLDLAQKGAATLDRVYTLDTLDQLENDVFQILGAPVQIAKKRVNAGPQIQGATRWPALLERIECDRHRQRLADFAALDEALMDRLSLAGPARCAIS